MNVQTISLNGFESRDTINTGTGVKSERFAGQLNCVIGTGGILAIPHRDIFQIGATGYVFQSGTDLHAIAKWYREEIAGERDAPDDNEVGG